MSVHSCIAQTYLPARRMTTIGMETEIQQKQHEYLSRLIYIFLLQIFTDKMTRDRIEAGPQPSAIETSSREVDAGEKGGKEASVARMLDAPCRSVTVETREICRRENIYPAIVKRNFRRREKHVFLREAVSWKRYVNSRVSRMYQQLCPHEQFFRALYCHNYDVIKTNKENH